MYKFLLPILLILTSNIAFAKKPKCDYEMSQLKKVQAVMKKGGYGEYTRDVERKLHTKYQNCRKNKNNYSKKNSVNTDRKKLEKTYNQTKIQPYKSSRYKKGKATANIKGRYQGVKQDAWIQHYKTPKKCFRPKSISAFATCLKHRDSEAIKFDAIWKRNNAPQSFKLG